MDPRLDALAQRLAQNPQDAEALNAAYQHGQTDPRGYAMFLEKVAKDSRDPVYAAHWFSEAATVWTASLNDLHRAARALMSAVDRDPTHAGAAERLAALYQEKGDKRALVALLERRTQGIAKLLPGRPELRPELGKLYGELARFWAEELNQPEKALAAYKAAAEHDPENVEAIRRVRESLSAAGRWAEAIPYFEREQRALGGDRDAALALYLEEAEASRAAGKPEWVLRALRKARELDGDDPVLKQQVGATILEQIHAKVRVTDEARLEAARLFVELAETYGGEHGFSYSGCALECEPSNDRAAQLLMFYGEQLGQELGGAALLAEYLRANPGGAVASQARELVGRAVAAGQDELLDALEPPADADPRERVAALLELARGLSRKANKREALAKYREVLEVEPGQKEAVEFVEQHLRQGRKYAELRDVLLGASAAADAADEDKIRWLEEVASLCEGQLRDVDGALEARRRLLTLEASDDAADRLEKLLEKASRWDELAAFLERRAAETSDLERKLTAEKRAADIHTRERQDPLAAGEAWARVSRLTPGEAAALEAAVECFQEAERLDRAAALLAESLDSLQEDSSRIELGTKLGELRAALGAWGAAGEAYAEAAGLAQSTDLWRAAEDCFQRSNDWERAANAVGERAELTADPAARAELCALEADYLERVGDVAGVIERLERATELDPTNDALASRLETSLSDQGRTDAVVALLLRRAERLAELTHPDEALRRALRKRAAKLQLESLGDREGMRSSLLAVLEDGEDAEALRALAEDAESSGRAEDAADLLGRLIEVAPATERVELTLRQAGLLADGVGDIERALDGYRWVREREPGHPTALRALARLLREAEEHLEAAEVLEELLESAEGEAKLEVARSLADLYEGSLDQPEDALRVLEIVHGLDEEDFEAIERLSVLSERLERWEDFARYLALLAEVEGDEEEVSRMTLRLAEVLTKELGRPEEALRVLGEVADLGDPPCRDEFVRLGDELGKGGDVARKLVEWHLETSASPARAEALRGALERFVAEGANTEAIQVALDLVRTKAADTALAEQLEKLALQEKDLDALSVAHDLLVRELTGPSRAEEMVRQAEVLRRAGAAAEDALQQGEQGLSSVAPDEVEPLLERLAGLAEDDGQVIGLYERQVMRCKSPGDRLLALARAAEVAAERGALDRAREFYDIALAGGGQGDQVAILLERARAADAATKGGLRRILAEACVAGGEGARDGGRTRSFLLGQAATIAREELDDDQQAFQWLQEALVVHADEDRLDQLEALADAVGAPERAVEVIGGALEQVFDGPLVRLLLRRRALLRRDALADLAGAAEDFKRLHDLSPGDGEVAEQLEGLYEDLGDVRGLVGLYEDQILRSKDGAHRAELATKVARLWEGELDDAREAADAWRRVLRMKSGDEEAKAGLARAKAAMLGKPPPEEAPLPAPDTAASALDSEEEALPATATSDDASEGDAQPTEAAEEESPAVDEADAVAPEGGASEPEAVETVAAADEVAVPDTAPLEESPQAPEVLQAAPQGDDASLSAEAFRETLDEPGPESVAEVVDEAELDEAELAEAELAEAELAEAELDEVVAEAELGEPGPESVAEVVDEAELDEAELGEDEIGDAELTEDELFESAEEDVSDDAPQAREDDAIAEESPLAADSQEEVVADDLEGDGVPTEASALQLGPDELEAEASTESLDEIEELEEIDEDSIEATVRGAGGEERLSRPPPLPGAPPLPNLDGRPAAPAKTSLPPPPPPRAARLSAGPSLPPPLGTHPPASAIVGRVPAAPTASGPRPPPPPPPGASRRAPPPPPPPPTKKGNAVG